jgi:Arc/MetJ-type ribon-helix-helix transcriptional regulator
MSNEMPIIHFRLPADMKAELHRKVPRRHRGEALREALRKYLSEV